MPYLRKGEVSEWLKEHAWKACVRRKAYRGFESRPLRQKSIMNRINKIQTKGILSWIPVT